MRLRGEIYDDALKLFNTIYNNNNNNFYNNEPVPTLFIRRIARRTKINVLHKYY